LAAGAPGDRERPVVLALRSPGWRWRAGDRMHEGADRRAEIIEVQRLLNVRGEAAEPHPGKLVGGARDGDHGDAATLVVRLLMEPRPRALARTLFACARRDRVQRSRRAPTVGGPRDGPPHPPTLVASRRSRDAPRFRYSGASAARRSRYACHSTGRSDFLREL